MESILAIGSAVLFVILMLGAIYAHIFRAHQSILQWLSLHELATSVVYL
ncbi:hypothetical protein J2S13_002760 [Oikeobacillus pervagus]|uniref:Uncharacterized protein n=2 Tax=Oikeobacillus pervagus TaxID=1325931 RepID=A0AAJ1T0H0_9BACI|nr:hypothetical protein [Oikeobacillus pervagus]